jgi:flagellar protein FliO/FliZ
MSATPLRVAAPLSVATAAEAATMPPPRTGATAAAPGPPPAPSTSTVVEEVQSAPSTQPATIPSGAPGETARPVATATAADAFASRVDGVGAAPAAAATASVATPSHTAQSPADAGSLGGAVLALVLVVGLILLLSWLARRMPGLGLGAGGANPALRIVGSLALGPRDRLVVVEVGATQLLVAVGAGGTRTLHTLAEPLPTPAERSTPAFAQVLAQHFGKKP